MVKEKVLRIYDKDGFRRRAACICVRSVDESEVLLVTSSRRPELWIVPGGGVEPDEEPAVTAVREVLEEAGVVGTLGRCLGTFEVCDKSGSGHFTHHPPTLTTAQHVECSNQPQKKQQHYHPQDHDGDDGANETLQRPEKAEHIPATVTEDATDDATLAATTTTTTATSNTSPTAETPPANTPTTETSADDVIAVTATPKSTKTETNAGYATAADHKHRTEVFVMTVTEELVEWEDSRSIGRNRKWFTIDEALSQLALHKPTQRSYLQELRHSKNPSDGGGCLATKTTATSTTGSPTTTPTTEGRPFTDETTAAVTTTPE